MNNVGSNGYVWSSSLNTSNITNAHNLNFNSGNANVNNNNRYNGFSVRGVFVSAINTFLFLITFKRIMPFALSRQRLLMDLYIAFDHAKKHKSNKEYVKTFEKDLHKNLCELCDELYYRRYTPQPSMCFIVNRPKKREVFAAHFRDRIVHHLYYDYTHEIYERTFIYDTYSCIKNKGTHFGINRLDSHIKKESHNYARNVYILKMDISGYFMHIDRVLLLSIALETLFKMKSHRISKYGVKRWEDVTDFSFLSYLTRELVLLDPTIGCLFKCDKSEWIGLPASKSMFNVLKGYGMPIGNLTSQLFSNVFLNVFDNFVKRTLKCKRYGRYVDDFYIVSYSKKALLDLIPMMCKFLKEKLHLDVNQGKTHIFNSRYGVEFLGAYLKPWRRYISNQCLRRMRKNVDCVLGEKDILKKSRSINSFLGILSHYSSFKIRKELFKNIQDIQKIGFLNSSMSKIVFLFKPLYETDAPNSTQSSSSSKIQCQ